MSRTSELQQRIDAALERLSALNDDERADYLDHSAVCQVAVRGLVRNFQHHPDVQEMLASLRQ